ncbi:MAG: Xaa-Pro peptidase family protein [Chloroflexi bacterium]|nr:Xaa-Pro peptidase family protein [Chloroflexota bacterium]
MAPNSRIGNFQKSLRENGVGAAILLSPRDIYYFAATSQQATLVIPAAGEPTLLVTRDYWRAKQETHLADVRPASTKSTVREIVAEKGYESNTVGLIEDVLSASTYRRLVALLPRATIVDVTRLMRELRMVKDDGEVEKIRLAAQMADHAHEFAMSVLKPGMTELEASFAIEMEMARNGHDGYCLARNLASSVRICGVVSGESLYAGSPLPTTMPGGGSSPLVSYGPSRRKLAQGDIVVVDLTGAHDGYIADEARTYTLGKASPAQREVVSAVKHVIDETLPLLRPGTRASDIFHAAQKAAIETGYGEYFLGGKEKNVRFVGHGVGLELDELPMLAPGDDTILTQGMALAYEPIFAAPGIGAGTLENTLLITENGHETLTRRPVELMEL